MDTTLLTNVCLSVCDLYSVVCVYNYVTCLLCVCNKMMQCNNDAVYGVIIVTTVHLRLFRRFNVE